MHVAETSPSPTVKCRELDGTQIEVVCPPVLPDYQAYMRGVDRAISYKPITMGVEDLRSGGRGFSFI